MILKRTFDRRVNLQLLLYFVYVITLVLGTTQISDSSLFHNAYIAVERTVFLANTFLFLQRTVRIKWLLISTFLLVVGLVVAYHNTRYFPTALLIIYIINGLHVDYNKLLKHYVVLISVVVGIVVLLTLIGVFYMDVRERADNGHLRYYMGFTAQTYLSNYFFHIIVAYIASLKRIRIGPSALILFINYFIYRWTDTRAVYYMVILAILMVWAVQLLRIKMKSRVLKWMFVLWMPALAVTMIYIATHYTPSNSLLNKLNSILTGRLALAHEAIRRFGFNMFGHSIEWVTGRFGIERTEAYFYVDTSYVNAPLIYGMPFFVFVIIGFCLLSKKAYEGKNRFLVLALFLFALHCFTDPQLLDLKYDPFLLMLGVGFVPYLSTGKKTPQSYVVDLREKPV